MDCCLKNTFSKFFNWFSRSGLVASTILLQLHCRIKNLDFNNDGFRDLPTGNQFSLINRWKYDDGKGFLTQFGVKVLNDQRIGGELSFDPNTDKNTTNKYGLGINT